MLLHAVFGTLGNRGWLVNQLIFHPRGKFYNNSFNRNISPLPLSLLKYTGENLTMVNVIQLFLNSCPNL